MPIVIATSVPEERGLENEVQHLVGKKSEVQRARHREGQNKFTVSESHGTSRLRLALDSRMYITTITRR